MDFIYCGKVSNKIVGQQVTINGWVSKKRKLGSLIFLDITDRYGLVQVVFHDDCPNFNSIEQLTIHSVVSISGEVKIRSNKNDKIPNGDIEIIGKTINVLSLADPLPFVINSDIDVQEETRLKYRYLDLRNNDVRDKIIMRSKIINAMRSYLLSREFIEIETPYLSKTTPEGARDYLVPTRNKNKFFALPQSPQIYKQLLMVAGFNRYFQVARCFRDEDMRADRQPEFTQLDVEMSFTNEKIIMDIISKMLQDLFLNVFKINIDVPMKTITYHEAMTKYGSDKPDLRFDLQIHNGMEFFQESQLNIFKNIIGSHQDIGYLICDKILEKNDIDTLRKYAKDNGAFDLMYFQWIDNKLGKSSLKLEETIISKIFAKNNINSGTLLAIGGKQSVVLQSLGAVRNVLADILHLKDDNKYAFVWVTDWPLFEFDQETNRYQAAHHPFTSPSIDSLATFDKDFASAKARAYDIVLNGFEIGGGSIRITDPNVQKRMFNAIGLNEQETNDKFGFLLNAFHFGTPPHGGIALGLDRLIMILTKAKSIREVIAFPKNSQGIDLMMETPSSPQKKQLDELNINIKNNN